MNDMTDDQIRDLSLAALRRRDKDPALVDRAWSPMHSLEQAMLLVTALNISLFWRKNQNGRHAIADHPSVLVASVHIVDGHTDQTAMLRAIAMCAAMVEQKEATLGRR